MKSIPETIKKILGNKNITTPEDIESYLHPKLNMLPHPKEMKGIAEAVEVVCDCINTKTDIIIWGDYDVDGTTATSLLVNFLRELGVEASWYIPNRLTEGYGLDGEVFQRQFQNHITEGFLLITVDCGISDSRHIETISGFGGKIIVTDHHQLPLGDIPDCIVLNPSQDDCGFNNECLAGVGVAFYLAAAVRDRLARSGYFNDRVIPNMKNYLGFVALGTIADLVELTFTNRVLVRAGMESLSETSIPGLRVILDNAGINSGVITTEDVSFGIGPRINAAGRLGKSETAVGLMTCDNLSSGESYSKSLEKYNNERKRLCDLCLESALNELDSNTDLNNHAICVAGEYHVGVVGIVASKLVERFGKPTIVFSRQESDEGYVTYKGSGRSVEGVSILECLHDSAELIMRYGGHAMAAGLTVDSGNYEQFIKRFFHSVKLSALNNTHGNLATRDLIIESSIDEVMDNDFLNYLSLLEPFGPGNEKPVFVDRQAQVVNCKAIGVDGQHLQVTFRGKYVNHHGVAFGFGNKLTDIKKERRRELFFVPMLNRFRGKTSWQVRVVSI